MKIRGKDIVKDDFIKKVFGVDLWEKQLEIRDALKNHKRVVVKSCNGAGKTFLAPLLALEFIFTYKNSIVLNTAPTWRQVENQYWRYFRGFYDKAKIDLGGEVYKTKFNIDEDWFALGLASNVNNVANFQGWHGKNILVIFDEGSGIPPIIWEALEGALSGGGTVRFLAIGNPNHNSGPFFDAFSDPRYKKITISAFDIPNVKEGKDIIQGLSTLEWVEEMKLKYGEDSDVYRVRVLGEFPMAESDTLISYGLVQSSIGAERERYGEEEIIGLDVARFGNDKSAFVYRRGNYAKVLEVIDKNDLMELAGKSVNYLKEYPNAKLFIDVVGNGAGVYDRLKEQPLYSERVYGVASGGKPNNTDEFINIRMESWHNIKEWLRDGILEDHEGWYELSKPKYKINSNGKLQLEGKEDMKKRGVPSPNIGDAIALTLSRATEGEGGIVWI